MGKRHPWILVALLIGLAGCGDEAASNGPAPTPVPLTSAQVLQPGPAGVGVTTLGFEDTSRPTMPNGTYPGAASRTLVTEVWYPTDPSAPAGDNRDAPVARTGGPFPLIIYGHGFMSNRFGGAFLARHLASHGYVVASCDYPLTFSNAPGGPNIVDLANQPADVHFLIDQLLALGAGQGMFAGALDAQRIGLTGLSLGGSTTFLATFHPTLRDPRVRAAAPMAGGACFFGRNFYGDTKIPLLIVHGDLDAIVPYREHAVFAFGEANAPKYLATIVGGSHTSFTDGADVLFERATNADDLGCVALLGNLAGNGEGESFLDLLGGTAAGLIAGDCPMPCTGPRHGPRSIRPSRQHQLTILSIFPFFEASLRSDERARQFLISTVAAENPDIRIDHDP